MNRNMNLKKLAVGGVVCVLGMAAVVAPSSGAVGVDVSTPNVRVQVGTPAPPPPPQVTVVERERVIVREKDRHDQGKHKGHYKKHKKHKKHDH